MDFRRVIAAAVTPIVRNYLHHRGSSDSEHSDSTVVPSHSARSTVQDEEMARRPLLANETSAPSRQSPNHSQTLTYGTILNEGPSSFRASPERYRRDSLLDRVPEERAADDDEHDSDAEAEEWDLAEQGYYSGSYRRTLVLYALVPITSILVFALLAILPTWIGLPRLPPPTILPRSIPSPIPEFVLSAAFWTLSHHLRVPLYNLTSLVCPRILDTIIFNALHVVLSQVLRLVALAALRVRHEMAYPRPTWQDGAFRTVWWLGLGWGFAEAATSTAQMFQQLALYRNVMVPEERVREVLAQSKAQAQAHWGMESLSRSVSGSREYMPLSPRAEPSLGPGILSVETATNTNGENPKHGARAKKQMNLEELIQSAVEQDVEQLIQMQEREELEEVYGLPIIYIPVFVPCLQRLDSFLLSQGFTLILSWAYLLSPLSFPSNSEVPPIYSNHALAIVFPVVVLIHLILSVLHSPLVLPRIGVHTTAYIGLLAGLGGLFTGLGLWGALA